ncbi:hypothetical protein ACIQVR_38115 [Streptomyces xanthochromogenes]|uniref:hypothetical protein n=1 Tax=Streptomyces xanthochromogenes TaxID=67384 RepID=UPI00381F3B45
MHAPPHRLLTPSNDQRAGNPGSATANRTATGPARGKVLLAYFSRPGENYYYGDRTTLKAGNTEVLSHKIRDLINCDLSRIEPAGPYPCGDPEAWGNT